jgi:hypothetical protein
MCLESDIHADVHSTNGLIAPKCMECPVGKDLISIVDTHFRSIPKRSSWGEVVMSVLSLALIDKLGPGLWSIHYGNLWMIWLWLWYGNGYDMVMVTIWLWLLWLLAWSHKRKISGEVIHRWPKSVEEKLGACLREVQTIDEHMLPTLKGEDNVMG